MNRVEITGDMTHLGKYQGRIFFESEYPLRISSELLVTATLIANMKKPGGQPYSGMQVDREFKENIRQAQALLTSWRSYYQLVDLDGLAVVEKTSQIKPFIGCFFSGGVDSFYTLLEQQAEITHLICIHGFDIPVENKALFALVEKNVKTIAQQMGIQLILIKTNLRAFFTANEMDWGGEAFGTGLASVGHLLADQFSKIYIPASLDLNNLMPWGSHPELDPLWSSGSLQFVHHGCLPRIDKIKRLTDNPLALKFLRVCYLNKNNAYNCCKCEKCIRTMVSLHAYGVLDCCESFPKKLSLRSVKKLWITSEAAKIFVRENISLLAATGHDPELQKVLEGLLETPKWKVDLYLSLKKKKNRFLSVVSYLVERIKTDIFSMPRS